MLLALGSAMIELIPSIFSHILLLTDINYLSYLFSQHREMWFITASNCQSLLRYSHFYDVCFDLDAQKMYATDALAVVPSLTDNVIEAVPVLAGVKLVRSACSQSRILFGKMSISG